MGYYDVMQVCIRGHQITDRYNEFPQDRQEFCSKCGARTINKCPKCNTPIRGDYISESVVCIGGDSTPVPYNCHRCGTEYPWAKKLKGIALIKSLGKPFKSLLEIFSKILNK